MPITYDITEHILYQEGLEKGMQRKLRKMILKGLQQGILTIEQIAEMAEVDVAFVLELQKELDK